MCTGDLLQCALGNIAGVCTGYLLQCALDVMVCAQGGWLQVAESCSVLQCALEIGCSVYWSFAAVCTVCDGMCTGW